MENIELEKLRELHRTLNLCRTPEFTLYNDNEFRTEVCECGRILYSRNSKWVPCDDMLWTDPADIESWIQKDPEVFKRIMKVHTFKNYTKFPNWLYE